MFTDPQFTDPEIFDHPGAAEPAADIPDPLSPKKRNCGRTGPATSAGRAKSAQNSTKHGSCARTLVLPTESQDAWDSLLARWLHNYKPAEDSLEYDFVLKTAQAEWHRIRCQHNFDAFLATACGVNPFNWAPEQIKKHDLLLRYKTAAERGFQREYRLLSQHLKSQPKPKPEEMPREVPAAKFVSPDETSPTGWVCVWEFPQREGVTFPYPTPPPTNSFPPLTYYPPPKPGEPRVSS